MSRFFLAIFAFLFFISCSPHWMVREIDTKNIPVNIQTSSVDSGIQRILTPYRDSIEQDMSKVVTFSKTPLVKGKPESKLTNLVSDILLDFSINYCKIHHPEVHPDAAYVNYGGLRASLPEGKITVGHLFELMPFENEIVLIKITGQAVRDMADKIASRGGEGVAGMKLGIRNEKSATLQIGGKEIAATDSYWLVTSDYCANGGDQMSMLANPLERISTGMKIRDELIRDMQEMYKNDGPLDVKEDGRIFHEQ